MIRRKEGLKVNRKQIRRRRRGASTGEVRRATHPGHVWSHDFVHDVTADGRRIRCLTVVEEFTRVCLAIEVRRSFTAGDVVDVLKRLVGEHIEPHRTRTENKGRWRPANLAWLLEAVTPRCTTGLSAEPLDGRSVDRANACERLLECEINRTDSSLGCHDMSSVVSSVARRCSAKASLNSLYEGSCKSSGRVRELER